MVHERAWSIDDCEVGAVFVFDLDDDLFCPELLLPLQPRILVLDIFLQHQQNLLYTEPYALDSSTSHSEIVTKTPFLLQQNRF